MKTKFSLLLLSAITISHAQTTYEASDYSNINDQVDYQKTTALTGLNFTEAGHNKTWVYNLTSNETTTAKAVNPNESNYKSGWCTSYNFVSNCDSMFNAAYNYGIALPTLPFGQIPLSFLSDIFLHSEKTSNQLVSKLYGLTLNFNNQTFPVLVEYEQPDIVYKFPMAMGNHYIEPFKININFEHLPPALELGIEGNRENLVDGWGSLTVSGQTFNNVIRLKSVVNLELKVELNDDRETEILNRKLVTYEWFSKDYKFPVMKVEGSENNSGTFTPHTAYYITDDSTLSTQTIKYNTVDVYPNPTKGLLKTSIPQNEIMSIEVYNTAGQLVHNNLNINHLPKGNYIVKITTKTQTFSKKVVKD